MESLYQTTEELPEPNSQESDIQQPLKDSEDEKALPREAFISPLDDTKQNGKRMSTQSARLSHSVSHLKCYDVHSSDSK